MKKEYKKPEIEIYELEIEDVITTSGVKTQKFNGFVNPDTEADQIWNWGKNN